MKTIATFYNKVSFVNIMH